MHENLRFKINTDIIYGSHSIDDDTGDFNQPDFIADPEISFMSNIDGKVSPIWCFMWTEKKFSGGQLLNKTYCVMIPTDEMTEGIFDSPA